MFKLTLGIHFKIMKKYLLAILLSLSGTLAHADRCIGDQSARPIRSVYIVPQLSMSQLYVQWLPILTRLGQDTQQCFDLVIPASIPEFEQALLNGRADYAFMNPYHAVMAYRAHGYVPLVADGSTKLDGIVVVRRDSEIKSLEDLQNRRVAYPAPNAFAASLLTRSILAEKQIATETVYVNTHSNVYRSVILGDVAAGGGVNNTFDREHENVRSKLRVLYRTPEFTPHPFAASRRIDSETRQRVTKSFVAMQNEPELAARLKSVQLNSPEPVTYENNYSALEKLNLERFVNNAN